MKQYGILWLVLAIVLGGCGVLPDHREMTLPSAGITTPPVSQSPRVPLTTAEPSRPTDPEPQNTEPEIPESTEPPNTEPPESPTTEPTDPEPTDPAVPVQPGDTTGTWDPARAARHPEDEDCGPMELLEKYLDVEGIALEDYSCRQLVLVVAQGNEARICCYEKSPAGWQPVPELTDLRGHVGERGIRHNRKRDSMTSPAGIWSLDLAFGNGEKPGGLLLPWRDVTPDSDWVCDAASPLFNTWQERQDPATDPWDWEETEHLENYPRSYAYACTTGYNMEPWTVPERGCAIFFHCGEVPTEGCVSLPQGEFLPVLLWLNPYHRPHILMTGQELTE